MNPDATTPPKNPPRWLASLRLAAMVFALSLAFAVAVPLLQRAQIESRAQATADHLRAAAEAFHAYARERGDWPPPDATPGHSPGGMTERLPATGWTSGTPIGGAYAWKTATLHRGHRYAAAIAIVPTASSPVSSDRRQLEALDRHLDNGDLTAGNFRLGYRNLPLFVLEH